ncbi:MAG: heavy metal translocating P-type ATPase [Chloroflexota bacterium]
MTTQPHSPEPRRAAAHPAGLPPEGTRCTDVLSDTLQGYAGIREASFDLDSGGLHIAYDPRLISPERALQLVRQAGRQAGVRVANCAAKAARGEEACAACAAQMGAHLAEHYRRVEQLDLQEADLRDGAMRLRLADPGMPLSPAGLSAAAIENVVPPAAAEAAARARRPGISRRQAEVLFTAGSALFTLLAALGRRLGLPDEMSAGLFTAAYALGGWYGLLDGIEAVREEKKLDVNLLMILAALGAAVIGQPLEGAVLLFLFSLSNTLQSFAMERNRRAIQKLLDLRPPMATVRRGSRLVTLAVEKVRVGEVVLVRPGERIPVDGEIVHGASDVNQAVITGESLPVHRQTGDTVFASTINGSGALEVRTARLAQDTTLAKIVQMVEEAQASKARTQSALDQFEQVYAWFVLGGAVVLALVPLAFGAAFQPTFYRAMTWLVVASPCALVISTPASILSAIANGARSGVLFKGGIHLEKTAGLKVVAFDKTGTLTSGQPALQVVQPLGELSEAQLLARVAALEARSEHPLGRAILRAAQAQRLDLPEAGEFRAIPGQGVEGRVEVARLWVGNLRLFAERGVAVPAQLQEQLAGLEQAGQTAMLVYQAAPQPAWLGLVGLADTLRDNAGAIIQGLKSVGVQRVVMLTGDNEAVAGAIARRAGVDEYHAGLLPQDKVRLLQALRRQYGEVAMVGDGVNDAPALAAADVGIAMGGAGSDVALETADLVLMADDLGGLPHAIGLARQARRVIWQNLSFSLAVIVLLVVSAFGLDLPLPLGVVGHEGSTVLVVLNGLRLLAYRRG